MKWAKLYSMKTYSFNCMCYGSKSLVAVVWYDYIGMYPGHWSSSGVESYVCNVSEPGSATETPQ